MPTFDYATEAELFDYGTEAELFATSLRKSRRSLRPPETSDPDATMRAGEAFIAW
jgi:hypothetical protein